MKKVILLVMLLPVVLFGQQYSFESLMEKGLSQSYTAKLNAMNLQSSASQLSSAKWNLLPEANLSLGTNYRLYDPHPELKSSDLSSSFSFQVSKAISLNDPAWFSYQNALLNQEKAQIRKDSNIRGYVYQCFSAYLDVLSSTRQLVSLEENQRLQNRILEQSRVLLRQGKATEFEVKQNEISQMNSQIGILKMQNNIDKSRKNLFNLLGIKDEGFALAELDYTAESEVPALALTDVDALRLMQKDIEEQNLSLYQYQLDLLPRISVSYNFNRGVSGFDYAFDSYSSSHGIALNFSYSLWNQFRQSETVKRAKISKILTELAKEDKESEVSRDYELYREELSYHIRLDELYEQKRDQAEEQIRNAEERYRLGMIQQLDLDKARSEFLDADIAYSTNRYQIIAKQEAINYLLSNKILGKW